MNHAIGFPTAPSDRLTKTCYNEIRTSVVSGRETTQYSILKKSETAERRRWRLAAVPIARVEAAVDLGGAVKPTLLVVGDLLDVGVGVVVGRADRSVAQVCRES